MFLKTEHLWQAARILVACGISYGGSKLMGLQEGYWALITAVVVTQPALGSTLSAGRDRVIGTVIGALAGLAVLAGGEFGVSTSALFWIALIPLAVLTAIKPNLRLCCITLVIAVLVPSTGSPFVRPLQRVLEILIGTLASIIVTAVFPKQE
jgi:uncharacterized membrane protein YccC